MKPVKRSKELQPLSRDHHHGLLFCWKIKQGLDKSVELDRIKRYISYFSEGHLFPHFDQEENLLNLKRADIHCAQAINDHIQIKNLIEQILSGDSTSPEMFNSLIDDLNKHIRFEERVLFPHLEAILSPEELDKIGNQLNKFEMENHFTDVFADEFWVIPK